MTSEDQSLSSLTSLSHTLAGSTPAKGHTSPPSSSYSGESEYVEGKARRGTPSASSEGSRRSAVDEFSRRVAKIRSKLPQEQSSSSTARTYALPKEQPVRLSEPSMINNDTGPVLPEITPCQDQPCGSQDQRRRSHSPPQPAQPGR